MTTPKELEADASWREWVSARAWLLDTHHNKNIFIAGYLAANEAADAQRWRPIETAPKDGTSILGYWMGGQHDCAIHVTKFWRGRWWEPNEDYPQCEPTHWMPLPQPPAIDAAMQRETK
jgi:hypothetical protein